MVETIDNSVEEDSSLPSINFPIETMSKYVMRFVGGAFLGGASGALVTYFSNEHSPYLQMHPEFFRDFLQITIPCITSFLGGYLNCKRE